MVHNSAEWKTYDGRNIVSRRFYLQCLLMLSDLLPRVGSFPSDEPADFYALVLEGRGPVAVGQGAKAYKLQLALADGDMLECVALAADCPAPKRAEAALEDRVRALEGGAGSSGEIFGVRKHPRQQKKAMCQRATSSQTTFRPSRRGFCEHFRRAISPPACSDSGCAPSRAAMAVDGATSLD